MIPNILWQTWKTNSPPEVLKQHFNSWQNSNPQLSRNLCSDKECLDFIKNNFDQEVFFLYQSLPLSIMRADFWRIAVVYIHGGYYSDLDIICNVSLSEIIRPTVSCIFIKEINNISNFFFAAKPKHPVLKLALDHMIEEAKNITSKDTQSFGMHSLHRAVREYYNVVGTHYPDNNEVQILDNEKLKLENKLIHTAASLNILEGYHSWRIHDKTLQEKRNKIADILFFTTFNENGYDLYGKKWIETFINISNVYPNIKARIYYEGIRDISKKWTHPNITIVDYHKEIPSYNSWSNNFLSRSTHDEYVKTMTVRFGYKAFVIQDVLSKFNNDYLVWLDGDCVFKAADYENFPAGLMNEKFLACQVEENWDLNHVESGILIFDGKHPDTKLFNNRFIKNYTVDELLPMGQPYDGFVVFRSLLMSNLSYVNLNKDYGKGGIQSDPNMTFQHPEIKSRFIHNIGWTGKHQYDNWEQIFEKDRIYKTVKTFLFGQSPEIKKQKTQKIDKKLNSLLEKKILLNNRGQQN